MNINAVDSIQYQQWTTTDRSNLITVVQQVDEFLDDIMAILKRLRQHDFIAKVQASFVQE